MPRSGGPPPRLLLTGELLELRRRLIEIHVYRVELIDGGQQCRSALADQRTLGHLLLAGDTGDRRGHVGITEIDARGLDVRLGLFHGGGGGAFGRLVGVELLLRYEVTRDESAVALRVGVGIGGVRPRLRQGRAGPIESRPVRGRIDLEERLAGLDLAALLVEPFEEDA